MVEGSVYIDGVVGKSIFLPYKLMQEPQDAWIGYCIGGRENIYIMLIKSGYS